MSAPRPVPKFARRPDDTAARYLEMARYSIARACDTGDDTHIWSAVMQLRSALALHLEEHAARSVTVVNLGDGDWLDMRTGFRYCRQQNACMVISSSNGALAIYDAPAAALVAHLDRLSGGATAEVTP